jgi:hypothetical protein
VVDIEKTVAQVELLMKTFEKKGFKRVGDVFYSPQSQISIEDGRPPWAEPVKQFSRVRSFLFVL